MAKILFLTFYDTECLGIRIIAEYLQQNGHQCKILLHRLKHVACDPNQILDNPKSYQMITNNDFYHSKVDYSPVTEEVQQAFLSQIENFSPDIIGISTRSYLDDFCIEFAQKIRTAMPQALIIAGGFGPTLSSSKYLEQVDIVVRGDGEEACLDIANSVASGSTWKNTLNIAYKAGTDIVFNNLRAPEKHLSKYPGQGDTQRTF